MTWITCSNCDEELSSFDPLEPVWCPACKLKAKEVSDKARKEFSEFGERRCKVRESLKDTMWGEIK
jgi:uncharacterized Zn finger protein (UPF0148 family)